MQLLQSHGRKTQEWTARFEVLYDLEKSCFTFASKQAL